MDKQNYNDQDHLTSKDLLKVIIDIAQHSATREELRDTREELLTTRNGLQKEVKDSRIELQSEIQNVRTELQETRTELKSDIQDVRTELRNEIQSVRTELQETRTELKTDIGDVRSELREFRTENKHNMYWIIGTMIALMGLLPNLNTIISFFK